MPVKRCYQLFGGNRAGYSARARDLVTYTLTNLRMQEVGVLLRLATISNSRNYYGTLKSARLSFFYKYQPTQMSKQPR